MIGPIVPGDTERLKSLVPEMADLNVSVVLESPGGLMVEGQDLINVIVEIERTKLREKKLMVAYVNESCASMCIPVFFSFMNRFANPTAQFGFHGPSSNGGISTTPLLEYIYCTVFDTIVRISPPKPIAFLHFCAKAINNELAATSLSYYTGQEATKIGLLPIDHAVTLPEIKKLFSEKGSLEVLPELTSFLDGNCKGQSVAKGSEIRVFSRGPKRYYAEVRLVHPSSLRMSSAPPFCKGTVFIASDSFWKK